MKFPVFQKKSSVSAPVRRLVIHLFALGGSGAILALAFIIRLLAMDDENAPRIDLRINTIDFDAKSDAQALLHQTAAVLSPMLTELSHQQDISRVLGGLHSISVANSSVLNETEWGETVGSCVRKLARTPHRKAEFSDGLRVLVDEKTRAISLGSGGYGSPVAGALIAASHVSQIEAVVADQIREAEQDNTAEQVHLVMGGLGGATGFALTPEVLRGLLGQERVYTLFDGGVFLPHSNVFSMNNYQGTRDVIGKADAALCDLHRQHLLDHVNGVVLRPLNRENAPHKLCEECKAEHAQKRHASIEYLLGAEAVMDMIISAEGNHPGGIVDLAWNADMEDRPLGWYDLGMDGVKYHRVLRKLAVGAATQQLLWNMDDAVIVNIPAIDSILRKSKFTLDTVKEMGTAAAGACRGLLQMFWDFAVTGSNLENLSSDLFTIEDHFRLLNIQAVENILKCHTGPKFSLSQLSSYREFAPQSDKVKEKSIQIWNGGQTIKTAVDSAACSENPADFYIRLFRTVV